METHVEEIKDIDTVVKEIEESFLKEKEGDIKELILHNDDYNSFDHIVIALMKICKHSSEQAQQCALIAHHNSKCSIKKDSKDVLEKLKDLFKQQNIIVTIE